MQQDAMLAYRYSFLHAGEQQCMWLVSLCQQPSCQSVQHAISTTMHAGARMSARHMQVGFLVSAAVHAEGTCPQSAWWRSTHAKAHVAHVMHATVRPCNGPMSVGFLDKRCSACGGHLSKTMHGAHVVHVTHGCNYVVGHSDTHRCRSLSCSNAH